MISILIIFGLGFGIFVAFSSRSLSLSLSLSSSLSGGPANWKCWPVLWFYPLMNSKARATFPSPPLLLAPLQLLWARAHYPRYHCEYFLCWLLQPVFIFCSFALVANLFLNGIWEFSVLSWRLLEVYLMDTSLIIIIKCSVMHNIHSAPLHYFHTFGRLFKKKVHKTEND